MGSEMCIRDRYIVPLWSYHWALDGWRFSYDRSSTFSVCVSSELLIDERGGRWLGTSPCDNERNTIALRTNALRAYEGKSSELIPPGARSRVGTVQLNWVSSAYCPSVTYLLFGGRKAPCCFCWCGTPAKAMGVSTAAGGARAQGTGGVHRTSWGSQRGGGRADGRLKPDVKVTIGGDRPPT